MSFAFSNETVISGASSFFQHSVCDFCGLREKRRLLCLISRVGLKRDTRAVGRDVDLLERFGLLRTRYEKNPGHGKRRIVESRAAKY